MVRLSKYCKICAINIGMNKLRDKLFAAMTPSPLRRAYEEHGREIANAISYSRELIAPYLFYTAAHGTKGVFPGSVRLLKALSDGYDGFVAKKDKEFASSEPSIKNLREFRGNLIRTLMDKNTGVKKKSAVIWRLLGDTDGAIFDQLTDKSAQKADQAGNFINGDVPGYYLFGTLFRNWSYDRLRTIYGELGVEDSGTATSSGKAKTLMYDAHQTLESFGALENRQSLRNILIVGGAVLNIASAVSGITQLEKKFLSQNDWDTSSATRAELLTLAAARLLCSHNPNIEIGPANMPRISTDGSL
jgi:phosphatidylglycerophosphate synthase